MSSEPYIIRDGKIIKDDELTKYHKKNNTASYHCPECGKELINYPNNLKCNHIIEIEKNGHNKLHQWFELSYASFLTLPRVLMYEMSDEWQGKIADLLNEYDETFPNQPNIGTRVQITQDGKLIKTPEWIINYRRPDYDKIKELKGKE